jgi:hypothetical protein
MSFMIVAEAGQIPESWRVDRMAAGTLLRLTGTKPIRSKSGAAVVVARKTAAVLEPA